MKKLTKKFKGLEVEITFAESKEYDTVRETFIEGLHEGIKTKKNALKAISKRHKEKMPAGKGNTRRKEVMSSGKKQGPELSKKAKVSS